MKCDNCGSTWETNDIHIKCPFCGNPLVQSSENNNFSDVLRKLINQYGIEVISEKKTIAYLRDYLPKEFQKIKLLDAMISSNVSNLFVKLYKEDNSDWLSIRERCAKALEEKSFIARNYSYMIIDELEKAINISISPSVDNSDSNQINKRIQLESNSNQNTLDSSISLKSSETEDTELYMINYGDIKFTLIEKINNQNNTLYEIKATMPDDIYILEKQEIDPDLWLKAIEYFKDKVNGLQSLAKKNSILRFLEANATSFNYDKKNVESIRKFPHKDSLKLQKNDIELQVKINNIRAEINELEKKLGDNYKTSIRFCNKKLNMIENNPNESNIYESLSIIGRKLDYLKATIPIYNNEQLDFSLNIINDDIKKNIKAENLSKQDYEKEIDILSRNQNKYTNKGIPLKKITVDTYTYEKFDIVHFGENKAYMCLAFCEYCGEYYIFCEQVVEETHKDSSRESLELKHCRRYKLYHAVDNGYMYETADKNFIFSIKDLLLSSLNNMTLSQKAMIKLTPELINKNDLDAAKDNLKTLALT